MKKNLTLISLMLGVMLLVTIAGVSAGSTDYRTVTDVKVNGSNSVTINPNGAVNVAVTVALKGKDWT